MLPVASRSWTTAIGVAWLLAAVSGWACAGVISLTGQLDPNNPQDVFLFQFTLSAPTPITIQSWGYGGTLSASGGTNAQGAVISHGGFDPYVSLFKGTGATATFVASNDDGVCPPGTIAAGHCYDPTLTQPNLPAGTYTLALSGFLNMSLAENYGSGTLGDGFVQLGSFGGRSNNFAVDISAPTLVMPTRLLGYVPNELTFGPQTLNVTSGALTVLVTNIGTATVTVGTVTLAGSNPGDFSAGGTCAGAALDPGTNCSVSVTFRPTVAATRSGLVVVISDASNSPLNFAVRGSGTASAVASAGLSATDVDFGVEPLFQASPDRTITVTNVGTVDLSFGVDALGGVNPGDFKIVADACAGQTITAGGTCTVQVYFLPSALGPRSATYTFNSNASNNPATVTLRGIGAILPILPVPVPALNLGGLLALSLLVGLVGWLAGRREWGHPST